jgi:hypothetical protein
MRALALRARSRTEGREGRRSAINGSAEMIGAGIVSSGVVLPPIPPVTGAREKPVAGRAGPLPFPIVAADRRNSRLIEVAPDQRIVREFPSPNLKLCRGNDDARHRVIVIDPAAKEIVWQYGATDRPGHAPGFLVFPDGMDVEVFRDWKGALAER